VGRWTATTARLSEAEKMKPALATELSGSGLAWASCRHSGNAGVKFRMSPLPSMIFNAVVEAQGSRSKISNKLRRKKKLRRFENVYKFRKVRK
jgi:hypothetical protein